MKKRYLLPIALWGVALCSCSEDNIEEFHGERQIFFDKFYMNALSPGTEEADTTRTSFFLVGEDENELCVKLAVQLSGDVPTHDLTFGLRAVPEGTTAEATEYALDEQYVFHARPVAEDAEDLRDTIEVTLKRSARLDEVGVQGLQLEVELVPSEELGLGQYERRRAVIVWTNVLAQPEWWDYEVQYMLLGEYSYDKYRLFLEVVPGAAEIDETMISEQPSRVISMVSEFRQWLMEHVDDPEDGALYQSILDSLV